MGFQSRASSFVELYPHFMAPCKHFSVVAFEWQSDPPACGHLRRQRSRLGAPKAITATAHKLARILYHVMRYGLAYMKQTEEVYAEQVRQRQEKQLRRRAKELGYELTKIEKPATPTAN